MLIEGALRFGRQALQFMEQDDMAAADEPLLRTIDIVGEMLVGVRGSDSEIRSKLAELYLFVFGRLAQAKVNEDSQKLQEAIKILEFERETWRLACAQDDHEQSAENEDAGPKLWRSDDASRPAVIRMESVNQNDETGISFEA